MTAAILPPRCACRAGGGPGGPEGGLCAVAFRLKGRLDAEYQLACANGRWDGYDEALRLAAAHVGRMVGGR